MKALSYASFAFGLFSGAAASGLAMIIVKFMNRRENERTECILFSPCDMHHSRSTPTCEKLACPLCNFNRLCSLLRTTKTQLDLCMYLITEPELANIVVRLYKRGVSIRIITDKQMSEEAFKCKSGLFIKQSIPMRCFTSKGMMHNKFFIIDKKIVVSGSCNWTQNGFMSNYENILVVKNEEVAHKYSKYFNALWTCDKII